MWRWNSHRLWVSVTVTTQTWRPCLPMWPVQNHISFRSFASSACLDNWSWLIPLWHESQEVQCNRQPWHSVFSAVIYKQCQHWIFRFTDHCKQHGDKWYTTFPAHSCQEASLISAVLAAYSTLFHNVAVAITLACKCRLTVFCASNIEALEIDKYKDIDVKINILPFELLRLIIHINWRQMEIGL